MVFHFFTKNSISKILFCVLSTNPCLVRYPRSTKLSYQLPDCLANEINQGPYYVNISTKIQPSIWALSDQQSILSKNYVLHSSFVETAIQPVNWFSPFLSLIVHGNVCMYRRSLDSTNFVLLGYRTKQGLVLNFRKCCFL